MGTESNDAATAIEQAVERTHTLESDRRTFVAGLVLAGAGVIASSAKAPAAAAARSDAAPLKAPKGLGPRAMIDNRFAVSYQESVPTAVRIMTDYYAALAARDVKAMAQYFHYPFASWESINCVIVNTPEEFIAKTPASMNVSMNPERFTDHDGYMSPGCYDVFGGLEVLTMDPITVGISMQYMRYDDRGRKLLKCEGIYAITNNAGKWAIQAVSTIFTPADQMGVQYPDAEDAANRLRLDNDIMFQHSDRRYAPEGAEGKVASVINHAGQPYMLGPHGRTLEQFNVPEIKSRLVFLDRQTMQQEPSKDMLADFAWYRELFPMSGVGNWGFVYGKLPNTRVLHTTHDKVHIFTGAIRYTTAGEEASHNTNLGVIVYQQPGVWRTGGILTYTTPHDRSNDMKRT